MKEHKDNRNLTRYTLDTKKLLTLAAGFTNLEHEMIFTDECVNKQTSFEVFFKKGGFIYRYTNCMFKEIKPLQLKLNLKNGPIPFSLKNFRLRKITAQFEER